MKRRLKKVEDNARISIDVNIGLKIRNMLDFRMLIYCTIMGLHNMARNVKKYQNNISQNQQIP